MMHLNVFTTILADATTAAPASASTAASAAPGAQSQGSPLGFIFPMLLILVIMYFLMIRPQSQQRKQQAKLQESLKSGDRIVTTAGIVGIVISVKDKTVSIRSADAKMEVTTASIVDIIERGGDEKSADGARPDPTIYRSRPEHGHYLYKHFGPHCYAAAGRCRQ
jgi:preprotein translocase subunit YajC